MKKILVAFTALTAVFALQAQADDANAQKALQKAQFMLRQVSNEKAELQTQMTALQQQVDQLTRELVSSKSSATSSQQATEQKYSSAIAQWKQRDTESSTELTAVKLQLKQEQTNRQELEAQLQRHKDNFSFCYANNKKLYDISSQLLTRYENKSFGDVLKQKEPFTGFKQVELENLVQDYRYQMDDLKISADGEAGSATAAMQAPKN